MKSNLGPRDAHQHGKPVPHEGMFEPLRTQPQEQESSVGAHFFSKVIDAVWSVGPQDWNWAPREQ